MEENPVSDSGGRDSTVNGEGSVSRCVDDAIMDRPILRDSSSERTPERSQSTTVLSEREVVIALSELVKIARLEYFGLQMFRGDDNPAVIRRRDYWHALERALILRTGNPNANADLYKLGHITKCKYLQPAV